MEKTKLDREMDIRIKMNKNGKGLGVEPTLFLEVVVALEARAETIDGLAGLADPESDGVESSAQRSHFSSGVCKIVRRW